MPTYECTCGETISDIVELVMHECDGRLVVTSLSSRERSTLMYVESRVVDGGGVLEPERMNHEDYQNLKVFKAAGILSFDGDLQVTSFTDDAWDLAHDCRRYRAKVRQEQSD